MKPNPTPQHTPGPWYLCGAMNGNLVRIVRDLSDPVAVNGGRGCIATVKLPHAGMFEPGEPSEEMANARLIGAAPKLADALQLTLACLLNWIEIQDDSDARKYDEQAVAAARAALLEAGSPPS